MMKMFLFSCFGMMPVQGADVLTAIDRLGQAGFQHSDDISEIKVLSDGKRVLSSSEDGSARLWDIESGKMIRSFTTEGGGDVWGVAIREGDQEFLAGCNGNRVTRYEIATGKVLTTYKHGNTVFRVALHPNGNWFAAGDYGNGLKLWDIEKGTLVRDFEGHKDGVYTLIFNADGSRLVSGDGDGEVKLWETETGECLKTITKQEKFKKAYTFSRSPDGKSFAMISDDEKVRVLESQSLKILWEVTFEKEGQVLDWSPDGKMIVIASDDESLDLLDSKTGKVLGVIPTGDVDHTPIAFTRDSKQVISGGLRHLHVYDIETRKRVIPSSGLPFANGSISALAVSDDGTAVYTEGDSDQWHRWNRGEEATLSAYKMRGEVSALSLAPDGATVALASSNGGVTLYDTKTGNSEKKLTGGGRIWTLDFSPDGKGIVGGGADEVAYLWSRESGEVMRKFAGHSDDIRDVSIAKNGRALVTGGDDKAVMVWNLDNGVRIANLPVGANKPHAVALVGGGNSFLAAVDEPGLMGRLLKPQPAPIVLSEERIQSLLGQLAAESFDKRQKATEELAAMGPKVLDHINKAAKKDPEVRSRIRGVGNIISGKADGEGFEEVAKLSDDITRIISDPSQQLWVATVGEGAKAEIVVGKVVDQKVEVLQTLVTGNSPYGLAFSPNGKFLAVGNNDGTLDLFRVNR